MAFSLLPRSEKFFDLFDEQAGIIVRASESFYEMILKFDRLTERAAEVKAFEHAGDLVTERIYVALDKSFLTPLDPEDIHNLAGALDDVLDNIEEMSHRFSVFRIDAPTTAAKEMSRLIAE